MGLAGASSSVPEHGHLCIYGLLGSYDYLLSHDHHWSRLLICFRFRSSLTSANLVGHFSKRPVSLYPQVLQEPFHFNSKHHSFWLPSLEQCYPVSFHYWNTPNNSGPFLSFQHNVHATYSYAMTLHRLYRRLAWISQHPLANLNCAHPCIGLSSGQGRTLSRSFSPQQTSLGTWNRYRREEYQYHGVGSYHWLGRSRRGQLWRF